MKEHRDSSNRLTIELSGDDGQFNLYASRLKSTHRAKLTNKLDGLDQRYWDFKIKGKTVVLHSDNYMGVSVHIEDGTNDDLLRSIAEEITK